MAKAIDFSGLMIGLSFFVIVTALLLTRLLFSLYLEGRKAEFHQMQILGFSASELKKIYLGEVLFTSLLTTPLGSILGIPLGFILLWGFNNGWQGAVNGASLSFCWSFQSIFISYLLTEILILITVHFSLRKWNLPKKNQNQKPPAYGKKTVIALLLFAVIFPSVLFASQQLQMILLVLSGITLLALGYFYSGYLVYRCSHIKTSLSFFTLALRNLGRNPKRSLAVFLMLSIATFLIFTISVNRKSITLQSSGLSSGTGGITYYMESALPLIGDLNQPDVRNKMKLEELNKEVRFIPLPTILGSEASCLNLNRVVRPHISGISPDALRGRFSFRTFLPSFAELPDPWEILNHQESDPTLIPAVADMDVIQWILGKKLGDVILVNSPTGTIYKLKLMAGLENSLFQGHLLISQKNLHRIFPDQAGASLFMITSPPALTAKTKSLLDKNLGPFGLHLEKGMDRLNRFHQVQNTYLSVFALLGALSLILGCGGLSILNRRNIMERSAELRQLMVLGFSFPQLKRMIFYENFILFVAAISLGILASIPIFFLVINSPGGQLPTFEVIGMVLIVLIFGTLSLTLSIKHLRNI